MAIDVELETEYLQRETYQLKQVGRYHDGSIAIEAFSYIDGPASRITVCIDVPPAEGNIMVKSYSENSGMLEALIKAGVIDAPVREHPTGFVYVYECPLTEKGKQIVEH